MQVLGVDLERGADYRVITDVEGAVLDREATYLYAEQGTLVMDTRRDVGGEVVGGTSYIPIKDIVILEPV